MILKRATTCDEYVLNLLEIEKEKNLKNMEQIANLSQEKQSLRATITNLELRINELEKGKEGSYECEM